MVVGGLKECVIHNVYPSSDLTRVVFQATSGSSADERINQVNQEAGSGTLHSSAGQVVFPAVAYVGIFKALQLLIARLALKPFKIQLGPAEVTYLRHVFFRQGN